MEDTLLIPQPVTTKNITPLNVLFVDDDCDESYLFNEALEHAGISVVMTNASDGNHFAKKLSEYPLPDLVFLDINMPYKDGLEILTEIRTFPVYGKLPIIIYSTSKVKETIKACYKAGADLYVVKPEDFEGLVEVVNKVCSIDWKNFQKPALEDFVISVEY